MVYSFTNRIVKIDSFAKTEKREKQKQQDFMIVYKDWQK